MTDPFRILGLSSDANDAQVRQAYLDQLRRHPPEHDPERFRQIRSAFELIDTERKRRDFQLFAVSPPNLDALYRHLLEKPADAPQYASRELTERLATVLKQRRLTLE